MNFRTTCRELQPSPVIWWRYGWPLGLFCILAGSRWLLDEALPTARSTTFSAGAGCMAAAGCLWIWRIWSQRRGKTQMVSVHPFRGWTVSLSAAFLLAAPALSGVISDRHLSGNAATLALALTPVVVAVATAASGAEAELAGLLWPGLAGLAGLLLLLPQPSLSSWRMDLGLVGMPVFAGLTATYLGVFKPNMQTGERDGAGNYFVWIEYGLLFAALLFGLTMLPGLRQGSISFSWAACGADGLLSALTLWLLERVGAVRWSAQFLLGPLLTILEGVVLLRPTVTARSWVGLLLMAIGGGYLLVPRPEEG